MDLLHSMRTFYCQTLVFQCVQNVCKRTQQHRRKIRINEPTLIADAFCQQIVLSAANMVYRRFGENDDLKLNPAAN